MTPAKFLPPLPGGPFLVAVAILAAAFLILGMLPWSRAGTLWRPSRPALEQRAAANWDGDLIQKGKDYRSNGYGRYFFRKGFIGLLLVLVIVAGWHRYLRLLPGTGGVVGMTAALVLTLAILDLVHLPFGLAAWDNARRVGLSTQGIGSWLLDWAKAILLDWPFTALVGAVLFFLIARMPRIWPLPATLLAGAGGVILILLVPLVIDPLFNKFTPLVDPKLSASFLELARKGGVPAQEVLVSDASRRTTAVNAYFTGIGPTRRIVVFDTMIEKLTPKESELVLAHEVGHWARNHIVLGLVLGTLGLGVGLLLFQALTGHFVRHRWFGINGPLDPAAAPVYVLLYWLGLFLAMPLENGISRKFEREADQFALDLTRDPVTQLKVEVSLARTNLSDVVPPPFIEALLYTHPKTLDRMTHAQEWAAAHGVPLEPADPITNP
ncbi:MAG: M48 family metallopeptidase [Candidatus Eisenbacteria bacterium]|nr:M48 family metallopeptidase [Candidatus Eisenbacteria bacterium]